MSAAPHRSAAGADHSMHAMTMIMVVPLTDRLSQKTNGFAVGPLGRGAPPLGVLVRLALTELLHKQCRYSTTVTNRFGGLSLESKSWS